MVACLEEISGGTVQIGGHVVNDVSSKNRDIAMFFPTYALYPQTIVAENIGFDLMIRRLQKAEIKQRRFREVSTKRGRVSRG